MRLWSPKAITSSNEVAPSIFKVRNNYRVGLWSGKFVSNRHSRRRPVSQNEDFEGRVYEYANQDDGDYAYRRNAIDRAVAFDDCNTTKAVISACDDVPTFVQAACRVLERDDLTLEQRRESAETLSTRAMAFEVDTAVVAKTDAGEIEVQTAVLSRSTSTATVWFSIATSPVLSTVTV